MNPLSIFFDHHSWANERVIGACISLSDEQLDHSDPGTYGSIRATILHLVRSDARYLAHLTGQSFSASQAMAENASVLELHGHVRRSGEGLREIAIHIEPDTPIQIGPPGKEELIPAAVVLLQAIYHASEHRSHINTLLGQLGIKPPPISGWDYYDEVLAPPQKG
jgi:uncharacterized damage-inducible protein DinB